MQVSSSSLEVSALISLPNIKERIVFLIFFCLRGIKITFRPLARFIARELSRLLICFRQKNRRTHRAIRGRPISVPTTRASENVLGKITTPRGIKPVLTLDP